MALIPTLLNQIPGYKALSGAIRSGASLGTTMARPSPYIPQAQAGFNANSTTSVSAPAPSLGVKAMNPQTNLKPASNALPAAQQAPKAPAAPQNAGVGVDAGYFLRPGESLNDYNARIAAQRGAQGATGAGNAQSTAPVASQEQQGGLYGALIRQLAAKGAGPGQEYQDAIKAARDINAQLASTQLAKAQSLADNATNPIPLQFQQGRAQVLQSQYGQREAALASQFQGLSNLASQALQQQQLQQSALQSAAGLAAPQQVPYSNQYIDPTTGMSYGGYSAGGGSLQDAVSSVAQQVRSGMLGYDQGLSQLNAYGQAGINALRQALGADFDIVGSNSRAAARSTDIANTGSMGANTAKAATAANQALDALDMAYKQLPELSRTPIPLLNQFAQNLSLQTGIGRERTSAYIGALNEARAQLRAVLGSAGVNDLAAGGIVDTLLPDNMIPSEVPQKIAAARAYITNRVAAFTSPGLGGPSSGGGGGGLFDW